MLSVLDPAGFDATETAMLATPSEYSMEVAAAAALDLISVAAIGLAPDLRIIFANAPATALLARHAIPGLDVRSGRLRLPAGPDEAVRAVIRASGRGAWVRLDGTDAKPIIGRLLKLTCPQAVEGPYLLFLNCPDHVPPAQVVAGLRTLYGLTDAEARITALVGQGLAPHHAAVQLGITDSTARAHLKLVFLKMGVSRQSELVSAVLRLRHLVPSCPDAASSA